MNGHMTKLIVIIAKLNPIKYIKRYKPRPKIQ